MADNESRDKHSPLPWHRADDGTLGSIVDANSQPAGHTFQRLSDPHHVEREANADLIIKAVNNHEALVAALRDLYNAIDSAVELTPKVLLNARAVLERVDRGDVN